MHSSTSSSDRPIPSLSWHRVHGTAALALLVVVLTMELALSWRGFEPTVQDSNLLWARQRARAGALGPAALVLVGKSRVQLGVDLDLLRDASGMEPVQIAVDGNPFLPILQGLAADPEVRGTVVVSLDGGLLDESSELDESVALERYYQREYRFRSAIPDSSITEAWLRAMLHRHVRSYADGSRPLDALLTRAVNSEAVPQYLVTYPDRSRAADYSRVPMPQFYLNRVARLLGVPVPSNIAADTEAYELWLTREIGNVDPVSDMKLQDRIGTLRDLAAAVRSRGGIVVFLQMPVCGLVRDLEERRQPRAKFWDRLVDGVDSATVHYADVPEMRALKCSDGSHLDRSDRAEFTRVLARELKSVGAVQHR